ncbi:MAG: insulinase family protein, partial [Bdellovibrionales bacterium]|nr:insulinase family protein [Bdellovibrionales bacterium]
QVNAYTSDEQTVYYGTVVGEHFEVLHDIIFEMARPTLDQKEFDVEKNVILEEIALYEDRPGHVLYQRAIEQFFADSPLKNSVLGTTESVSSITREMMVQYLRRRYSSSNLVVSVAGNFHWDEFLALSEARSQLWVPSGEVCEAAQQSSMRSGNVAVSEPLRITHPKCHQSHILLMSKGPDVGDPMRYPALIVSTIFGDSHNSRLYWRLVDSGIAEYASMDHEEKIDAGCMMVSAAAPQERSDEVLRVLQEELSRREISAEELEIAKTKLRCRMVMDHESSLGRAMSHAVNFQYRNEPFSLESELGMISSVSLEQCEQFLEQFPLSENHAFIMNPQ